jgi:hypothetical protein
LANFSFSIIKKAPWKVDVFTRLSRVEESVVEALCVKGWSLGKQPDSWTIVPSADQLHNRLERDLRNQAQAVVATIFDHTNRTRESLTPPGHWWGRVWELLTGELLMSSYTSLHAAEASSVLLLSADQLAAAMPSIRQRVQAYLAADDPRRVVFGGLPDLTEPAHQAFAQAPDPHLQSITAVHSSAPAPAPAPAPPPAPAPAPAPAALASAAEPEPDPGQPAPVGKPSDMLGRDQQIASSVLNDANRAEDLQQSQVRYFRNVLLGTFAGLLIVVVVLGIVGAVHPGYFPLCVQKENAATGVKICPSGGSTASTADLPLVLAIGGIGAILSVARNLTGLKPAGVRYSLSVGQGLVKIAFGAITAMLGIIILSTQTNIGFLGSQVGLLSTAVVFGYSQQLFTKVIDQQASDVLKAASSAP